MRASVSLWLCLLLVFSGVASLDASRLSLEGDFDAQVEQWMQNVQLPKSELNKLPLLVNDLEQTLRTHWTGCKVIPFGSAVTGLAMTTSDFDCYVTLPNRTDTAHSDVVIEAKNVLEKRPDIFTNVTVFTTQRVPLVDLLYLPSRRQCDVSFTRPVAVKDSELFGNYFGMDKRGLYLAMIVKSWAKVHSLTRNSLAKCLTILVIFYLQQRHILPPVDTLQRNESFILDNWNTGFNKVPYISKNNESLYKLLGGFFEYYSSFDFDRDCVCIFLGYPLKKSVFRNVNEVPDDFDLYKRNVGDGVTDPLRIDTPLCIQNPFDHNVNKAQDVDAILSDNLKTALQIAAKLYKEKESHAFLTSILTKHENCFITNHLKRLHILDNCSLF